jgi:hypothetical protein
MPCRVCGGVSGMESRTPHGLVPALSVEKVRNSQAERRECGSPGNRNSGQCGQDLALRGGQQVGELGVK